MMHWLDFLFPPRVDEKALRSVSDNDFLALVAPQLVPETRPNTVTLLPFNDMHVRTTIHEAKYQGNRRAFELLALALAEYLRDADDYNYGFTKPMQSIIVPVPLGAARRKERGYNQIEEIVRYALRNFSEEECPFILEPNLLVRTRETTSQVSLPRHKREENMRGAFGAAHSANPAHTYIVIDDVVTTGATLQATIDALKEAGATHIIPLALAH
jgi:ComF family protein